MVSQSQTLGQFDLHQVQQAVKWTVYALLAVNFFFYVYEDADRAIHTLTADSSLWQWTQQFATTIDVFAWFMLLSMFELETYVLEDRHWKPWVARTVHAVRIVAYLMIAHTVIAFFDGVVDYSKIKPVENVTSLCEMTDRNVSFVYNLEYTEVTDETCGQLNSESRFFWLGDDPLVTTGAGHELSLYLAWADLVTVVVWLLIILSIEIVVRQQERGITGGRLMSTANRAKVFLYLTLVGLAGYWAYLGHWLYTWDSFLWIAGFAAIEMNVKEWRGELRQEQQSAIGMA